MKTKQLITRSYVMTEEGTEYKLQYYLVSQEENHKPTYGIAIKQYTFSKTIECEVGCISPSEQAVLSLIDQFASHFVFPSTLQDLLCDWDFTLDN